jgi:hypothetical protein
MNAPAGVIEIMNRSGQVLQRFSCDGRELRVGRAYDNDIIVGDPYVCPHHLLISIENEAVTVKDLDSVNGTYSGRHRDRIREASINDGRLIHFGHSQLRFRTAGAEVAPTWMDTARHGLLGLFGNPWTLVVAAALALLTLTLDNLLDSSEALGAGLLASQLLYPIIGIFAWAGFWSLLNRVISHRANVHIHLAISCAGVVGLFLSYQSISLLGFSAGLDQEVAWLRPIGRITVLALVLYAHLRYATHGRTGPQAAVAIISAILLLGTAAVGDILQRSEFNSLPQLNPLLKPPAFQLKKGVSVEQFFSDAQVLRDKADDSAAD